MTVNKLTEARKLAGKRLSEAEVKRRERLIRDYVHRGYSANLIQRELQREGLGMRRKDLLKRVREIRESEKAPMVVTVRRARVRWVEAGKRIALYGTVGGESRRLEMYGTGRQLYRAMQDAVIHPPKKRFVECHAKEARRYLDYWMEWDYRPEVIS
ncbi:MAG: hypothetical protein QXS05_05650 [Candidatus Bathyarchaeia archaeon]